MNTKLLLPLLTSLLVMPTAISVVLPIARAEALVTVTQTNASALLDEANRLMDSGSQLYQDGQYQDALMSWQAALDLYQNPMLRAGFPQESRQGEGIALGNLAVAHRSLGQYQQTIDFFEQRLGPWQRFWTKRAI